MLPDMSYEQQFKEEPVFRCFASDLYAAPLPVGHPFPMRKFADSKRILLNDGTLSADQIIDPGLIDEADLLRVHTREYVDSIATGNYFGVTKRKLGLPWSKELNLRSRAASAGTLAATRSALSNGISCNLAGGTHHAFPDHGEGYCVFNDIAVAVRNVQTSWPTLRIVVLDLDAHQGNGSHFIFSDDPLVFTFSMHVGVNYPSKKVPGDLDIELPRGVGDEIYLGCLEEAVPDLLRQFKPDLCYFIAGVDVHGKDRFGQMGLSDQGISERDRFTISAVRKNRIPLVVVYGGGYSKDPDFTTELHCRTIRAAALQFRKETMAVKANTLSEEHQPL
jgi:acetoin utilization deacetylase AcuC-like enzyme